MLKKRPFMEINVDYCAGICSKRLPFIRENIKCINSPYEIKPAIVLEKTGLTDSSSLSCPKRWRPMTLRQLCLPKVVYAKVTNPDSALFILKTFKFDKIIDNRYHRIIYFSDAFFHNFLIEYYNEKYKNVKLDTKYFKRSNPYCICSEGLRTKAHIKKIGDKRKAFSDIIIKDDVCVLCNGLNSEKN